MLVETLFPEGIYSLTRREVGRLDEMDWFDLSPLAAKLKEYRGRYIHFTNGAPNIDPYKANVLPEPDRNAFRTYSEYNRAKNRTDQLNGRHNVPKIGVNPKSHWKDPKGVYFYPVDFLLSGPSRVRNGSQYGLNMKWYYIVDLNLSRPGVVLQNLTWEQLQAIAERNGWAEDLHEFLLLSPEDKKKQLSPYANIDSPGSLLWYLVESLIRKNKTSWLKAFKGLAYIRDRNGSIVHSNEPDQVIVFDPSVIKVVDFGEVHPAELHKIDALDTVRFAITNIIKRLRGEFGGDLVWKDKFPTLSFKNGDAKFLVSLSARAGYGPQLQIDYQFRRAVGKLVFKTNDLRDLSAETIFQNILNFVATISRRKSDLLFTPLVSERDLEIYLKTQIGAGDDYEKSVVIHNDDIKYAEIEMTLSRIEIIANIPISLEIRCKDRPDNCELSVASRIDDRYAGTYASSDWRATSLEEATDQLFGALIQNIPECFAVHAPTNNSGGYYSSTRYFRDDADYQAAIGWFVLNCGLSFKGRLQDHFNVYVEKYKSYDDKKWLLSEIEYVTSRSRY